jgi:hypothetical protein
MSEALQGAMTVQIFVKWFDNKTKTLEVVPETDTVAAVKDRILQKEKLPLAPERFNLTLAGKPLPDSDRLQAHGIGATTQLGVAPRKQESDLLDEEVLQQLRSELKSLESYDGGKLFVFIGVGSYDHGHGEESIKRQQCPESLLRWCEREGWTLKVLLVDKGFSGEGGYPQAFDLSDQGWSSKATASGDGKIRQYANKTPGHKMVTFATGVAEYGNLHGGKLAGYALNTLTSMWGKREDRCLVCGNFYASPTDKQDYITIGPPGAITGAGFSFNG